ncbi:Hypothetical predicted protein [Scomber scombrus]|uniref:Uncharacterized protein n=1 Tax=Scomber scombrus TaxID=13677 RepID=A0AAV1MTG2_SCOSC
MDTGHRSETCEINHATEVNAVEPLTDLRLAFELCLTRPVPDLCKVASTDPVIHSTVGCVEREGHTVYEPLD